mgnify:FL=1
MSSVWDYFKIINEQKTKVLCKMCEEKLKRATIKRANNTTNLWQHLEKNHLDIYLKLKKVNNQPKLVVEENNKIVRLTSSSLSKDAVDKIIANMIVKDIQPLSVVNDIGFKQLIQAGFPSYSLPGRKYFTNYLSKMHEQKVQELIKILSQVDYFSITADLWSSIKTESYITFTCHFIHNGELYSVVLETREFPVNHTAMNIRIIMEHVFEKWGILNKVEAIVTDNASNITNAVDQLLIN